MYNVLAKCILVFDQKSNEEKHRKLYRWLLPKLSGAKNGKD